MYQRKDRFYRRAKAEGLRSRAAFKLEDLDRQILRPGDRVVDLGCWPGGWLQIAARRVGAAGRVIGVDLQEVERVDLANVRVLRADVAAADTVLGIVRALGGPADVVLSDMSPKLSGIRDRDEATASELVRRALTIADEVLRPGGAVVCKVFMNSDYPALHDAACRRFAELRATRSQATRKGSAELYWIGRGFRPLSSS